MEACGIAPFGTASPGRAHAPLPSPAPLRWMKRSREQMLFQEHPERHSEPHFREREPNLNSVTDHACNECSGPGDGACAALPNTFRSDALGAGLPTAQAHTPDPPEPGPSVNARRASDAAVGSS